MLARIVVRDYDVARDQRGCVPRARPVGRGRRGGRPDARRVPRAPGQVHRHARELRADGRPARARLDPARAHAPAQAGAHGEGAGRGRPRPAHLPRLRGPGRAARAAARRPARGAGEVPQRVPLPNSHVGRRRRHRLAHRRGRDRVAEGAPQVLLRAVRADHEEDLLGGVVPHPPRPRRHPGDDERHPGAARARAGGRHPLVGAHHAVPRHADARGERPRAPVPDQDEGQRVAAPGVPGRLRAPDPRARPRDPRPRPALRRGQGRWLYTEPDWDELRRVVSGHGPASADRLELRRRMRDANAWVRRAVLADAA